MKQINLDEIIECFEFVQDGEIQKWEAKRLMILACKKVLDIAAEEAKVTNDFIYEGDPGYSELEEGDNVSSRRDGDGIPYAYDVWRVHKDLILKIKERL